MLKFISLFSLPQKPFFTQRCVSLFGACQEDTLLSCFKQWKWIEEFEKKREFLLLPSMDTDLVVTRKSFSFSSVFYTFVNIVPSRFYSSLRALQLMLQLCFVFSFSSPWAKIARWWYGKRYFAGKFFLNKIKISFLPSFLFLSITITTWAESFFLQAGTKLGQW